MTMDYSSGRGDPTRSLELLWDVQNRPSRGPKPGLSVPRIVRTAIEIADAEGLAAVSMRRIARDLGVGTMSLYRYVPGKDELIDIMLDTVFGEDTPLDTVEGGWRAKLEVSARDGWACYHRHPWMLQVAMARPPLGPNAMATYDAALRAVSGIGLTEAEMIGVVHLVNGYVRGVAQSAVEAAHIEQRTGVSDEQWWGARAPLIGKVVELSRFPTLTGLVMAGAFENTTEDGFEFGLQRLLDGVQLFIESRSAATGRAGAPPDAAAP